MNGCCTLSNAFFSFWSCDFSFLLYWYDEFHYLIFEWASYRNAFSSGSIEDLSSFSPVLKYMIQFYKLKLQYSQIIVGMRQYQKYCIYFYLNVFPQLLSSINFNDTSNEFDKVSILFPGRFNIIQSHCFLNMKNILSL